MYGFIGGGNMASAIIGGLISSGVNPRDITVSDRSEAALSNLKTKYNVCVTDNNVKVAEASDILFLCVKPNVIEVVCDEIKDRIDDSVLVISIAAGRTLFHLERYLGDDKKIIRVMPNTPALAGEGMSAVCGNVNAQDDVNIAIDIFKKLGRCEDVPEGLMDTVTAVSGSSPAYVFMLIEAMADGAVQGGMRRDLAYEFAAQAVLGSAKMVLETGMHPGALKDMVCSPGGTTIDAVASLEKDGFRNAVIKAMEICRKKSEIMSD